MTPNKAFDEMTDQEYQNWVEEQAKTFPKKGENITVPNYIHGINVENPDHLIYECPMEKLKFEIMGSINIKQLDRLRATLKVTRFPLISPIHAFRNTVDLYNDNQVKRFVREAAETLEIGTDNIKHTMYTLIEGLEQYRLEKRKAMEAPKFQERVILSATEQKEALNLLERKDLIQEIGRILKTVGLINEEDNGLLLFLIFLTRDFDNPLHALIHGSSGSGKSNLLKTVINCVPDENKIVTTSLTENALYYPPFANFWQHKILMLEDLDGAIKALYILREFMSNGSISKLATSMDKKSGDLGHKNIASEGPICIVGATTYEKIYEDNANRSFLIHVDETQAHQQDVMNHQNKIAAGLINKKEIKEGQRLLQNIQRLLDRKIHVINPFQPELILPPTVFKPLRSNTQYIALIQAITYLHQHQLEIKTDEDGMQYVETTLDHIALANKLCRESLLRKSDKLSGAKRTFFEQLKKYLKTKQQETFFTSDIAKEFDLYREQVKRNMQSLENAYLISKVGDLTKQGYQYKIETWEDYNQLNEGLNILDIKLEELRKAQAPTTPKTRKGVV